MKTITNSALCYFVLLTLPCSADPGAIMGSGNFTNGETGPAVVSQFKALQSAGARMCRISLYPGSYYTGTAANATTIDSVMKMCHQYGITPMILFEYYGNYNALGDSTKWYRIGRGFAERFRPNSTWLVSQGIRDWGMSIYTAINEPETENTIPKAEYAKALEGLADGVHSVDTSLRVNPGGFMSANAWSDYTLRGFGTALAPLYNNRKLSGIDLHTYYDTIWAPMEGRYNKSAQNEFDQIKAQCGITANVKFYSTEFRYKSRAVSENTAARGMLTAIWDNLGVVDNNGAGATVFAFPWNVFNTQATDAEFGLCTVLDPWTPTKVGQVLKMVLSVTAGLEFVSRDPKVKGEYVLTGPGKTLWVWQNRQAWTNHPGTSITITGVPSSASKLEVYGWDGLRKTVTLSNQTTCTVSGLSTEETYLFLATAGTTTAGHHASGIRKGASGSALHGQQYDLSGRRVRRLAPVHCGVVLVGDGTGNSSSAPTATLTPGHR